MWLFENKKWQFYIIKENKPKKLEINLKRNEFAENIKNFKKLEISNELSLYESDHQIWNGPC